MQFSTNRIAGCDFASLWPPHLEHTWVQKLFPVYGLLKFTKNMQFRLKSPCDLRIYQPVLQLAVFDIDLGGPMSILYDGYGFMTFVILLL